MGSFTFPDWAVWTIRPSRFTYRDVTTGIEASPLRAKNYPVVLLSDPISRITGSSLQIKNLNIKIKKKLKINLPCDYCPYHCLYFRFPLWYRKFYDRSANVRGPKFHYCFKIL